MRGSVVNPLDLGASTQQMAWLTELRENPFAPALRLLAAHAGQPAEGQRAAAPARVEQQQSPEASASTRGGRSAANDREEQKMQQYMRQFEQLAEKESRKKKMQALKQSRKRNRKDKSQERAMVISDPNLGSDALGFGICDLLAVTLGFDFGI